MDKINIESLFKKSAEPETKDLLEIWESAFDSKAATYYAMLELQEFIQDWKTRHKMQRRNFLNENVNEYFSENWQSHFFCDDCETVKNKATAQELLEFAKFVKNMFVFNEALLQFPFEMDLIHDWQKKKNEN